MLCKKIVIGVCILLFGSGLLSNIGGFASAEFLSSESSVSTNKNYDNAYLAGGSITVDGTTQKDLIGAGGTVNSNGIVNRNLILTGGTINIKSQVGASLFAAGGTILIDSPKVVGSVRAAAGDITLSGNYGEDVLVSGGNVVIRNANIAGDVYVGAGTLTVENSTIKGRIQGQYGELKGTDLRSQVTGVIDTKKVENQEYQQRSRSFFDYINLSWELSVLFTLLLVCWLLKRRNRLSILSIKWGGAFGKDVLIGLAVFILPGIIAVILLILQLFPLAFLLPSIVFLEIIASCLVLPIYVGNFIKNTWNLKLEISWLVLIGYFTLLAISLLSNVGVLSILSLISVIFALANIGFIVRIGYQILNQYLTKR